MFFIAPKGQNGMARKAFCIIFLHSDPHIEWYFLQKKVLATKLGFNFAQLHEKNLIPFKPLKNTTFWEHKVYLYIKIITIRQC